MVDGKLSQHYFVDKISLNHKKSLRPFIFISPLHLKRFEFKRCQKFLRTQLVNNTFTCQLEYDYYEVFFCLLPYFSYSLYTCIIISWHAHNETRGNLHFVATFVRIWNLNSYDFHVVLVVVVLHASLNLPHSPRLSRLSLLRLHGGYDFTLRIRSE